MDPITQGALGAAAAQLAFGRKLPKQAAVLGWMAGMAADLDVLMQVPGDPLSTIIHHRGITHSLAFIPIGAILPMLPFLVRRENRERWRDLYMISFLGYATHGLLDACTSYGTMLLLPFSNVRISWDLIGIIDAWFTIPLIVGVVAAVRMRRRLPIAVASAWAALYMATGAVQHARAMDAIMERAASRGHVVEHARAMPSPMSLVNWRTSYRADGTIHVDAAHAPYLGTTTIIEGGSLPVARLEDLPEPLRSDRSVQRGFEVFSWFADGFVAWQTEDGNGPTLGDFRYVTNGEEMRSFWGVEFRADLPSKLRRVSFQDRGQMTRRLLGRRE